MKHPLIAILILLGFSSTCYAGDSDDDWGPWGSESIEFSDNDKGITSAEKPNPNKKSVLNSHASKYQTEEKIVYGTGIIGRDENILHELDQSSLLDYQLSIDVNFGIDIDDSEFGTFPVDQEMSTQPIESEIDSSNLSN